MFAIGFATGFQTSMDASLKYHSYFCAPRPQDVARARPATSGTWARLWGVERCPGHACHDEWRRYVVVWRHFDSGAEGGRKIFRRRGLPSQIFHECGRPQAGPRPAYSRGMSYSVRMCKLCALNEVLFMK